MKYMSFIKNLPIFRTKGDKGNGVVVNLRVYMNKNGYGIISALNKDGHICHFRKDAVRCPCNDALEITDTFIDILYELQRKSKRIRKK